MFSWIGKIVSIYLLRKIKLKRTITSKQVKIFNLQQKIHFAIFNLIIVDLSFNGTRVLAHTQSGRLVFQRSFTTVLFLLMLLDILEISYVSATLVYETQKRLKGWKTKKQRREIE